MIAGPGVHDADQISYREFEWIRRLVHDHVGIDLRGKDALVQARLQKQMRELNLRSFRDLRELVDGDLSGRALVRIVDALTTNHTNFFREPQHFDFLRNHIVPGLRGRPRFRIWSAACSSGEEPYSIAFALVDAMGQAAHSKANILATDISTRVLKIAERGVYPTSRFQHLSVDQFRPHVLKGFGPERDNYMVKPEIRSLVHFERVNLMEDFPDRGQFSVIFCRNVMIYFDKKTQESLVNRLTAQLEPGGYLFIGHSESLNGVRHALRYIQPAIYKCPECSRSCSGPKAGR